jgi:hypothetical protein
MVPEVLFALLLGTVTAGAVEQQTLVSVPDLRAHADELQRAARGVARATRVSLAPANAAWRALIAAAERDGDQAHRRGP